MVVSECDAGHRSYARRTFGWSGPFHIEGFGTSIGVLQGIHAVGFTCPVTTDYRFSTPLLVRSMGALLAVAGVLLLLVGVLVGVLDLALVVLTAAVVLVVLTVVAGGFLLSRVTSLVHFDDSGYRVRWLRGAGVKQARWRDVEDAVTATVSGHDCVVLRLRDGRTTTIPVKVLDAPPTAFIEDLSSRLDRGHGYRRLR